MHISLTAVTSHRGNVTSPTNQVLRFLLFLLYLDLFVGSQMLKESHQRQTNVSTVSRCATGRETQLQVSGLCWRPLSVVDGNVFRVAQIISVASFCDACVYKNTTLFYVNGIKYECLWHHNHHDHDAATNNNLTKTHGRYGVNGQG